LHGDAAGSVDRKHNLLGSRLIETDPKRLAGERSLMDQPPYCMDEGRRQAVLASVMDRCADRSWRLLAAHIRTNHVHVVVEAEAQPERVMNDLKSYASRRLNQLEFDHASRKRWARHGSTRWLGTREDVFAPIRYVMDQQGEQMAAYQA
jgi:REP element-mobilizing transposase RayT